MPMWLPECVCKSFSSSSPPSSTIPIPFSLCIINHFELSHIRYFPEITKCPTWHLSTLKIPNRTFHENHIDANGQTSTYLVILLLFSPVPDAIFIDIIAVRCSASGIHESFHTVRCRVEIVPFAVNQDPDVYKRQPTSCRLPAPMHMQCHLYRVFLPSGNCCLRSGATSRVHPASSGSFRHWQCCWQFL